MGKTNVSLVIVPDPATWDRHNISSLVSCSQKQEDLRREKGKSSLNL